MKKVCPICNELFEQNNGNQVYCSYECKEAFSKKRKKEARKSKPKICKTCNVEFISLGKNGARKLTCSPECSLKNRRDASKIWKLSHRSEVMPVEQKLIKSHSAKVPKPDKRACKHCGDEFTPRHNGVKYCDDICKMQQNKEDKAEREKLGIKPAPRKTREQEYIPDQEVIMKNQFTLGLLSGLKREFNHDSSRYR